MDIQAIRLRILDLALTADAFNTVSDEAYWDRVDSMHDFVMLGLTPDSIKSDAKDNDWKPTCCGC